jgi:3-methyladenine DNA glycosylase AlkD
MNAREIEKKLRALANPKKAVLLQRFFKTGPGEYGEGDVFLGIMVPQIRSLVRVYQAAPLSEVMKLLSSQYHEQRLLALLLLVRQIQTNDPSVRKRIFSLYLDSTDSINNWDLVDLSAPNIAGEYLVDKSRRRLHVLARSRDLWKRRIAIISTAAFIRRNDFADTLAISETLLHDEHDLIHKATGWMLREVGKRDQAVLEAFLKKHQSHMPRTMLRYAIERFPEAKRKRYLSGSA